MNGTTVTVGIIVLSLGLLVGGISLASKVNPTVAVVTASSGAKAVALNTDVKWGNITLKSGPQKAVYDIANQGNDTLKLYNLQTSCTCTTAQFKLGSTESELFRMHTKSDYVLSVPPGQTAQVEAVFDPNFHGPSGVGHIERTIQVQTNDPKAPTLTFTASADVAGN